MEEGFRQQRHLNSLPGTLVGERQAHGFRYYMWTLGWGFGYVPLLAAAGGAAVLARRALWAALLLVPAPLLLLLLEGSYTRYYARYALPAYPFLCVLAGAGAAAGVAWLSSRQPRWRLAATVVVAVLLCGQGVVYAVHSDLVLRRTNTLTAARAWMVEHIPPRSLIFLEPIAPAEWQHDGGLPDGRPRWKRWKRPLAVREALARIYPPAEQPQNFQSYVLTLLPEMLDKLEQAGACWYVSGSTQSGRALLDPHRTPRAAAFYRALGERATLVHEESPFAAERKTPLRSSSTGRSTGTREPTSAPGRGSASTG